MQKIEPGRMLGRMEYAGEMIMQKYGLVLNQDVPDWSTFFYSLAEAVEEPDSTFCNRMAAAYPEEWNQAMAEQLDQFTLDHQMEEGKMEASYVFARYPEYWDKILSNEDFLKEIEEEQRQQKKRTRNNIYILLAIIAVLFIGIWIYNLPYFAEQRAYNEIEKKIERKDPYVYLEEDINNYLSKYPDGKHADEVAFLPVQYYLYEWQEKGEYGYYDNSDIFALMLEIDNYHEKYPDGKFADRATEIADSIWNIQISKYETKIKKEGIGEGEEFMLALLRYMQKNNIRTINVLGIPEIIVKNYDDYPYSIQYELSSQQYEDPSTESIYDIFGPPTIPNDLIEPKSQITEEEVISWVNDFCSDLQKKVDSVLTPSFITIRNADAKTVNSEANIPVIKLYFTIGNEEDEWGYPEVWITNDKYYSMTLPGKQKLIFGTEIFFDADFSIPRSDRTYSISGYGNSGQGSIDGIQNNEFYRALCARCMEKFSDQVITDLGF